MRLRDIASLVRSKNAGPFELTFDILFADAERYEAVKRTALIDAAYFAKLFQLEVADVSIFEYDPAHAFKITIPRPVSSGSPGDGDVYGCQQFGPLADLDIPLEEPI
jgi:hypothetical protein